MQDTDAAHTAGSKVVLAVPLYSAQPTTGQSTLAGALMVGLTSIHYLTHGYVLMC